jgi:hypothetical protein
LRPWAIQSGRDERRKLAILPRLAAAFNRSTLLTDSDQPDGENPADYYTTDYQSLRADRARDRDRRARVRIPV